MMDWSKMPSDENELYRDLAAADAAGNAEAAAVIAKRINMVKSANAGNVNIEDEYGGVEKFLIGAGRGFMDLGQGAKQKALMLGEEMGVVDEGRADEYTQEIKGQQQQFEGDFPGLGAESVGRFAGWAAPGALLGGASLPGAIAAGAVEGAVMPTDEADWGEVGRNALLGGGLGGLGKGIQRGLETPGSKKMIKGVTDKAEELYNRYSPSSSLQDEFVQGIDDAAGVVGQKWDELGDAIGNRQVDITPVYESILGEISRLQAAGGDPATMNRLIRLWDNMPRNTDEMASWLNLKEFRSNFSGANAATFAKEGMSPGVIKRLYGDITETMKRGLKSDDEYRLFQEAVDATKQRKDLIRQSKAPTRVKEGIPDEQWFNNVLTGSNADQKSAVMQLMTEEGAEGAKAHIMRSITDDFLSSGGDKLPSATKYKKLSQTLDQVFDPDEAAEVRGFLELLDVAKSEKSLQTMMKNVMTAGTIVGGVKAIPAKFALPALMRSKEIKAALQKLATADKGSRLHQDLIGAISSFLTQGTVGATEIDQPRKVPQIEIRNGVTQ